MEFNVSLEPVEGDWKPFKSVPGGLYVIKDEQSPKGRKLLKIKSGTDEVWLLCHNDKSFSLLEQHTSWQYQLVRSISGSVTISCP